MWVKGMVVMGVVGAVGLAILAVSLSNAYLLAPVIIIFVLIIAAAGLTRGMDLFNFLGIGALMGVAGGAGKGSVGKGLKAGGAVQRKAMKKAVGKYGKAISKHGKRAAANRKVENMKAKQVKLAGQIGAALERGDKAAAEKLTKKFQTIEQKLPSSEKGGFIHKAVEMKKKPFAKSSKAHEEELLNRQKGFAHLAVKGAGSAKGSMHAGGYKAAVTASRTVPSKWQSMKSSASLAMKNPGALLFGNQGLAARFGLLGLAGGLAAVGLYKGLKPPGTAVATSTGEPPKAKGAFGGFSQPAGPMTKQQAKEFKEIQAQEKMSAQMGVIAAQGGKGGAFFQFLAESKLMSGFKTGGERSAEFTTSAQARSGGTDIFGRPISQEVYTPRSLLERQMDDLRSRVEGPPKPGPTLVSPGAPTTAPPGAPPGGAGGPAAGAGGAGRGGPGAGGGAAPPSKSGLPNAYALLGLSANATDAEIRSAYRQMAKDLHPDTNIGKPAAEIAANAEKFKDLAAAYALINEARRAGGGGGGGAPGAPGGEAGGPRPGAPPTPRPTPPPQKEETEAPSGYKAPPGPTKTPEEGQGKGMPRPEEQPSGPTGGGRPPGGPTAAQEQFISSTASFFSKPENKSVVEELVSKGHLSQADATRISAATASSASYSDARDAYNVYNQAILAETRATAAQMREAEDRVRGGRLYEANDAEYPHVSPQRIEPLIEKSNSSLPGVLYPDSTLKDFDKMIASSLNSAELTAVLRHGVALGTETRNQIFPSAPGVLTKDEVYQGVGYQLGNGGQMFLNMFGAGGSIGKSLGESYSAAGLSFATQEELKAHIEQAQLEMLEKIKPTMEEKLGKQQIMDILDTRVTLIKFTGGGRYETEKLSPEETLRKLGWGKAADELAAWRVDVGK